MFSVLIIFELGLMTKTTMENAFKPLDYKAVLVKILMNFTTLIALTSRFDFNWPSKIEFYLNGEAFFGNSIN